MKTDASAVNFDRVAIDDRGLTDDLFSGRNGGQDWLSRTRGDGQEVKQQVSTCGSNEEGHGD